MNVLSIVAEIIRIGAEVFLPSRRDLLEWELQKIKEFREELEKNGERPKIGKDYPIDLRFDVASTRLRRFLSAFNDYKEEPSDDNLIRLERMFRELREVYVCPGCAEIYGYISELLEKIKDGGSSECHEGEMGIREATGRTLEGGERISAERSGKAACRDVGVREEMKTRKSYMLLKIYLLVEGGVRNVRSC